MKSLQVVIQNETGLHARPANLFVKTAKQFYSEISVIKDGHSYNGKSILSVLSIGAGKGCEITIQTDGEDEEQALRTLVELVHNQLGERPSAQ